MGGGIEGLWYVGVLCVYAVGGNEHALFYGKLIVLSSVWRQSVIIYEPENSVL